MSLGAVGMIFGGAVAYMALGGLWYSSFAFGKKWMQLFAPHITTKAEIRKMQKDSAMAYVGSFVTAIVMSGMLWTALGLMGINQVSGALLLATLIWIGFVATVTYANALFLKQPFMLWLINAGYNYAGLLLMSVLLVKWG